MLALFRQVKNESGGSDTRMIANQCSAIADELENFLGKHSASLPKPAKDSLTKFIADNRSVFSAKLDHPDARENFNRTSLLLLAAMNSELNYLLGDRQVRILARSELAFEHLQRTIVVDPDARRKWQHAFDKGEVACEQLGAVHLLAHDIWAFKSSAEGARTDLVYGEPVTGNETLARAVAGIVLTEWKKASDGTDVAKKLAEAQTQASQYASGVLGGLELTGTRFLVVVSEKRLKLLPDAKNADVLFRHINIAVNPDTPSAAAKQQR